MFWEILPWLIIGILFSIAIAIGYIFTSNIYGHKLAIKSTAQFFLVFALFAIIFYGVSLFLSPSQVDILWIAIYIIFSVLLVIALASHIQAKRRIKSETIMLDLGLDNNGYFLILGGIIFISLSISSLADHWETSQFQISIREFFHNLFYFLGGIVAFYKGIGSTVFTDERVFSPIGSIKWKNIKSYTWDESKLPILNLRLTGFWFFLNRASINIPNSKKQAVQDLLSQKLSNPENA